MGLDVLCTGKKLGNGVVEGIKSALAVSEHEGVKTLARELFAVKHDN